MQPTLLILAAGMGSRYGGLKQLDPMGPNGETVLDYSVFDAIRAGFGKVVFVIRRDFAETFKTTVGDKFATKIEVVYAYQDIQDLPTGFEAPAGREKPWGTAHAVRAARQCIDSPFAVINADDFYGRDAYQQLIKFFKETDHNSASDLRSCMVGYQLGNTLSTHGSVNRGLCVVQDGLLQTVVEHIDIAQAADGKIYGRNLEKERIELATSDIVSMNFWGFTPALFPELELMFADFLTRFSSELKSECYIPSIIDSLIQNGKTKCKVIETNGSWFGVTYPDDKPFVQSSIQQLITSGDYPGSI